MGEAMVEAACGSSRRHGQPPHARRPEAASITGKEAERLVEEIGFTVNKNAIPERPREPVCDERHPFGSAAMTTRGFSEEEARTVVAS